MKPLMPGKAKEARELARKNAKLIGNTLANTILRIAQSLGRPGGRKMPILLF